MSNKEALYEDSRTLALQQDLRFFIHWTLLSGGTLALLVPFLQSLNKAELKALLLLYEGEYFLLVSLVFAAISTFAVRKLGHERTKQRISESSRFGFYTTIKEVLGRYAVISYIVGLLFIVLFVNLNIT